eukprot:scaffold21202_cov106-Skeletonema_dohrnii-CCMP3373.AAC.1
MGDEVTMMLSLQRESSATFVVVVRVRVAAFVAVARLLVFHLRLSSLELEAGGEAFASTVVAALRLHSVQYLALASLCTEDCDRELMSMSLLR